MSNTQNPGALPSVTGSQVALITILAGILALLIAFLVWQVGGDALPWLSSVFGLTATGAATVGFVQNRHIQATTSENSAAISKVDDQLNGPMSAKIQASVEAAIVSQKIAVVPADNVAVSPVENVATAAPYIGEHVAPPVADAGPVSP